MNISSAAVASTPILEEARNLDRKELFVLLISLAILGILFVIGIGTNAILLLAFHRRPKLKTISNRFVGNLLIVNLLSTIFLIPLICIDLTPSEILSFSNFFNHPSRCILSEFVSSWVSSSSVLGTLLIGIDQYLAIVFPLRYSVIFRSSRAWLMLISCWFLNAFCAAMKSVMQEPSIWRICNTVDTNSLQLLGEMDTFVLPILKFIVLFTIPLVLIELIYTRIYLAAKANSEKLRSKTSFISTDSNLSAASSCEDLKRYSRKASEDSSLEAGTDSTFLPSRSGSFTQKIARSELVRSASNASLSLISNIRKRVLATNHFIRRHKEELRTAKISLLIVVLFLACWLPFHVANLLLRVHWMTLDDLPKWSIGLIHIMVVIYPSLSPCIFAFRCKKLQRELRRMMRRTSTNSASSDLPPLSSVKNQRQLRASLRKFHLKRKPLHHSTSANVLKKVEEEVKLTTPQSPNSNQLQSVD